MKTLVRFLSIVFLGICSWSCTRPAKPPELDNPKVVEEEIPRIPISDVSGTLPTYKFAFSSLVLNMPLEELDQRVFKHFGEFYTEDFTIFRLDRIDYLAESHYIDEINLYFIDSALVKIQAFLREDRSNELINQYGKAKISITDYYNRKILENEKVLTKQNGKLRINEHLNQYKLKWNRDNADIEYEVNEKMQSDSVQANLPKHNSILSPSNFKYKLTFQAKDFDYQMAWIKWESYKESRGLTTTIE